MTLRLTWWEAAMTAPGESGQRAENSNWSFLTP